MVGMINTGHVIPLSSHSSPAKSTPIMSTVCLFFLLDKKQASAKKPFSRRPIITDAKSKSSLSILATNEYGEFDRVALTLYDMDMLVEPHRKTTLTVEGFSEQLGHMSGVTFRWHMIEADENGDPLVGARPILDALGGGLQRRAWKFGGEWGRRGSTSNSIL